MNTLKVVTAVDDKGLGDLERGHIQLFVRLEIVCSDQKFNDGAANQPPATSPAVSGSIPAFHRDGPLHAANQWIQIQQGGK